MQKVLFGISFVSKLYLYDTLLGFKKSVEWEKLLANAQLFFQHVFGGFLKFSDNPP